MKPAPKSVLTLLLILGSGLACAGRLDYWQAWLHAGILAVVMAAGFLCLPKDLIEERSSPGPGAQRWDMAFVALFALCYLSMPVIAGLDVGRFHWTGELPSALYAAAGLGYVAGCLFFLWASRVNRFFSCVVRIQSERGHQVVDSGPYAWVRHPGYAGTFLYLPCMALVLGSLWALVPAGVMLAALVLRTKLEDELLQRELPGYRDYAAKVRYRLLPGLW